MVHLTVTPGSLRERLSPLEQLDGFSEAKIAAFLTSLRLTEDDVDKEAEFSEVRPYGRRLITRTPSIEILLMGFRPGRACPPHDHGGSDGLVYVCAGAAEHQVFRRDGGKLTLSECSVVAAGGFLQAPVDCVHAMGNPGPGRLITLHVYWPPIERMEIFDLERGIQYEVNEKAGAWLPVEPETLISATQLA